MMDPALVVMAAGIGSRYGGFKQIDPIGPGGEIVLDYSIYDALKAGFGKVVFVIRKDIEIAFREKIGSTVEKRVNTTYIYQELCDVPAGFSVPNERKKPWGTAHAVLCCKKSVYTPFAVINADDFYGATAYQGLAQYLRRAQDGKDYYDYCMIGYVLGNTLSEHGHVARGVCEVSPEGFLRGIHERTHIERYPEGVMFTENGVDRVKLAADCTVSMNMWGFTPSMFIELEARFPQFLGENTDNLLKAEYFLPDVVGSLVREKKARVKVLPTGEEWFGVTYPEDRPRVQAAIRHLIDKGKYPEKLWV
jgi:hypothetical protein